MAMRRTVGVGVLVGMGVFGRAPAASAQELGCCRAECHEGDRIGVLMMRSVTEDDCQARFAGCTVTWEEEASCPDPHPGLPGGFGEGSGGGTPEGQRPDLR